MQGASDQLSALVLVRCEFARLPQVRVHVREAGAIFPWQMKRP